MPHNTLDLFRSLVSTQVAIPVAAMNVLVAKIQESKAATWMELELELRNAIALLKSAQDEDLGGRTNISLTSGCDLFMKYVTRAFSMENLEFSVCKKEVIRRGQRFANMSLSARTQIAAVGHSFIQDGYTVLIHGSSRVVSALLLKAAETTQFSVIVTEGQPGDINLERVKPFLDAGIPTKFIRDSAVGVIMEEVDLCLVGAEGVAENGGIINEIGTYQIALVANALRRPFYVAVESYKFSRMYPLSQKDTLAMTRSRRSTTTTATAASSSSSSSSSSPTSSPSPDTTTTATTSALTVDLPAVDFTPANFITLMFTDLGVLTPAAVSDELIRLYAQ